MDISSKILMILMVIFLTIVAVLAIILWNNTTNLFISEIPMMKNWNLIK